MHHAPATTAGPGRNWTPPLALEEDVLRDSTEVKGWQGDAYKLARGKYNTEKREIAARDELMRVEAERKRKHEG